MKKPRPSRPKAIRERAAQTAAVLTPSSPVAADVKRKRSFNPARFLAEVKAEARKITWTSRRETWITSVMVFLMVALAGAFFFILDIILTFAMSFIFQLAAPGS